MKYRGMVRVAVCACGAPVIGGHAQPVHNRYWCGECVAFVDAAIRGAEAFHGVLPDGGLDIVGLLDTLERKLIQAACERTGNNIAQAARLLRVNRTTLVERLKRMRSAPSKRSYRSGRKVAQL